MVLTFFGYEILFTDNIILQYFNRVTKINKITDHIFRVSNAINDL
jgi:uncharacterized protein with NRDE domain